MYKYKIDLICTMARGYIWNFYFSWKTYLLLLSYVEISARWASVRIFILSEFARLRMFFSEKNNPE